MKKISLSENELRDQLKEQIGFLVQSCNNFDRGNISEGKRLAVVLRVLLHDTAKSISLLGQLKLKGIKYLSSTNGVNERNLLREASLVMIKMGPKGGEYVTPLDNRPPQFFSLDEIF